MKFIDFFAGCGGARRGLELAGHECIGFCEYDKFAVGAYTSMHLITEEQRAYLATLDLRKRQKEILKEEYRNGEWYANDIRTVEAGMLPKAELWAFGAPCQSFSVAGKRAGLDGESGLIREIFRLLGDIKEEDRPEWLIYENVKGMLSSNKGFDYLAIQLTMDELGYDIEWQLFNSKHFGVPQNRERVYTIGHLRRYGSSKIFPIKGADRQDSVSIDIIGHRQGYRRNTQVFAPDGITEALSTCQGGGREHHTIVVIGSARPKKDNFGADRERVIGGEGITPTLRGTDYKEPIRVGVPVIPVLTPERVNKRQNGRRFKEDGDPSFTLTSQDRHGVAIGVKMIPANIPSDGFFVQLSEDCTVYAVWYEKYQCYIAIRKLTPRECFRLQGWEDKYYERAEFVNSDSQLYKLAGNGITVPVIQAIGDKIKFTEEK